MGDMRKDYRCYDNESFLDDYVHEPNAYAMEFVSGGYTVDDYFALLDDDRKELIDGVFYDMASPVHIHQYLCSRLAAALDSYIIKKGAAAFHLELQ